MPDAQEAPDKQVRINQILDNLNRIRKLTVPGNRPFLHESTRNCFI